MILAFGAHCVKYFIEFSINRIQSVVMNNNVHFVKLTVAQIKRRFSEKLYVLDCAWNYRTDHCKSLSSCKRAETVGAQILHGNRNVFFKKGKQNSFYAVHQFLSSMSSKLTFCISTLPALETALINMRRKASNCDKMNNILFIALQKFCNSTVNSVAVSRLPSD
jgi:hypothetical protein